MLTRPKRFSRFVGFDSQNGMTRKPGKTQFTEKRSTLPYKRSRTAAYPNPHPNCSRPPSVTPVPLVSKSQHRTTLEAVMPVDMWEESKPVSSWEGLSAGLGLNKIHMN